MCWSCFVLFQFSAILSADTSTTIGTPSTKGTTVIDDFVEELIPGTTRTTEKETKETPPFRLPDILRVVTNYTDSFEKIKDSPIQDVHSLLVLLDAVKQADQYVQSMVLEAEKLQKFRAKPAETGIMCNVMWLVVCSVY